MTYIVGTVLALFSLGIVAYPFFRSRIRTGTSRPSTLSGGAPPELAPVYDAIRTLQLEYQLGKVPENLYREQLTGYRLHAASALRQQAEEQQGSQEWMLEQEVLLARAALRASGGGPRPCPDCRSLVDPEMASCPECGAKIAS